MKRPVLPVRRRARPKPSLKRSALLIIDVQQILCTGKHIARDVDGVINRINLVSRKARAAGTLVVVIQHETKDGDMDYGTESWKLAPALEVHSSDVVLRKSTARQSLLVAPLHWPGAVRPNHPLNRTVSGGRPSAPAGTAG